MLTRRLIVLSFVVLCLASAVTATAQTAPQQHLVQAGNFAYQGQFTLPSDDGNGTLLTYGGTALSMGADGTSLYYGCVYGAAVVRVRIPAIGGVATQLEPCRGVPNLNAINPNDPNAKLLGGVLAWNGRVILSGYAYYDGGGTATSSHFVGAAIDTASGPYKVGTEQPGLVAGYMGVVPTEWRTLLGGPALTGQCCIAIISRSSYGPSVSVFDPDQLGTQPSVPATMLVGYPQAHQTIGTYEGPGPLYNGSTKVGGVAFPAGTRSVLFVGRQGGAFCYGAGTTNQALHMTPNPAGDLWCYDPTSSDKGAHGYPYRHQVWAYDANDLLAVKQGAKQPWDVRPYATWTLTDMDNAGSATIRGATYDPATRRLYVTGDTAGATPTVHVYEITNAVLQPQGPLGFSAQVGPSSLSFSWTAPPVAGLVGYLLEAGTSPASSNVGVLSLSASLQSLTLPIQASGTFYVRLRASYADGSSGESRELVVTLGAGSTVAAPANFRVTASGTTVALNWDPTTDPNVSDVLVEAGSAPGLSDYVSGASLGTLGGYVASNLPAGQYYFRLRSVGRTGTSPASNEVQVIVGGGSGNPPNYPTDLQATVGTSRSVTLTWHASNDGPQASSFRLEVGSQSGLSDYGTLTVQGMSFAAGAVPPGSYWIRVRATNASGSSAPSSDIHVVVP